MQSRSPTQKIRLETNNVAKSSKHRQITSVYSIYEQVLCQMDLLGLICVFLNIFDIFGYIIRISSFQYHFVNHNKQIKLIQECLSYEFGNIIKLFNIKLDKTNIEDNGNNKISNKIKCNSGE